MTASVTEKPERVSGVSREEIFSAFYHDRHVPLKIGNREVLAKVARVLGTFDSGVFEIHFRFECPITANRHVRVPRYDTADAKGGHGIPTRHRQALAA